MGNQGSTLNIDDFFDEDIVLNASPVTIQLNLEPGAKTLNDDILNVVYLSVEPASLRISKTPPTGQGEYISHVWTPKSHMRDFEVIENSPLGKENLMIARGQGIGVVIIESLGAYIKLMYDITNETGVTRAVFGPWAHSLEPKSLLSKDLAMGYNILLIDSNNKVNNLTEPITEEDEKETMILIPELQNLAQYKH